MDLGQLSRGGFSGGPLTESGILSLITYEDDSPVGSPLGPNLLSGLFVFGAGYGKDPTADEATSVYIDAGEGVFVSVNFRFLTNFAYLCLKPASVRRSLKVTKNVIFCLTS